MVCEHLVFHFVIQICIGCNNNSAIFHLIQRVSDLKELALLIFSLPYAMF